VRTDALKAVAVLATAFSLTWTTFSVYAVPTLDAPLSVARVIMFAPGYGCFIGAAWAYDHGISIDPTAGAAGVALLVDVIVCALARYTLLRD